MVSFQSLFTQCRLGSIRVAPSPRYYQISEKGYTCGEKKGVGLWTRVEEWSYRWAYFAEYSCAIGTVPIDIGSLDAVTEGMPSR